MGKNLSYTGKSQELVTAGAASGGIMLYSLDGETYAAELPTATDPGEYTIYYKVVGDASHVDSEVQTVTATIVAKGNSINSASTASTARAGGSNLAKTGDVAMYAVFATIALVALAAAALADRRRRHD